MASGILENDTMFSGGGIRPWHGLGEIIDTYPESEEAIKVSALGWDVVPYPVFAKTDTGDFIEVPGKVTNVRTDKDIPLGITTPQYKIIQNKELFQFADDIIKVADNSSAKFETAGSLFNGRKVFILVRLPDSMLVGDKIENYMFIENTHDGTSSMMAGITNVRVVCNNTLQYAEKEATRIWKLRHSSNLEARKAEAIESLGYAAKYINKIGDTAEKLAAQKMSGMAIKDFFVKMAIDKSCTESALAGIYDIYNNKDDLQNFKGTAWGLYNAVADYASNKIIGKKDDLSLDRKMNRFLDGEPLLRMAQSILLAA